MGVPNRSHPQNENNETDYKPKKLWHDLDRSVNKVVQTRDVVGAEGN